MLCGLCTAIERKTGGRRSSFSSARVSAIGVQPGRLSADKITMKYSARAVYVLHFNCTRLINILLCVKRIKMALCFKVRPKKYLGIVRGRKMEQKLFEKYGMTVDEGKVFFK
jgi:hypothetical protein